MRKELKDLRAAHAKQAKPEAGEAVLGVSATAPDGGEAPGLVADITQAISDHATQPYSRLRSRGLFGFIDQHQAPGWIQAGPRASDEISIVDDPRRIQLAVVGAPTGGYTTAVFGSGITTVERIEHL